MYAALGAARAGVPRTNELLRVHRECDSDSPLARSTNDELNVLDMLATSLLVFLPPRWSKWESDAADNVHLYLPLLAEVSDQLNTWNAHAVSKSGTHAYMDARE